MKEFDARESVMEAIRRTEEFLKLQYEGSLGARSSASFLTRHAWKLNNFLHKINLHVTTYEKIRYLERAGKDYMSAWSCAGQYVWHLSRQNYFAKCTKCCLMQNLADALSGC